MSPAALAACCNDPVQAGGVMSKAGRLVPQVPKAQLSAFSARMHGWVAIVTRQHAACTLARPAGVLWVRVHAVLGLLCRVFLTL